MARKRKILIENFQEIIDSGDLAAFQAVFDKCEITAVNGRGKTTCNAFSFKGLTPAHIQFLIDQGLDPNADCGFGRTAVYFQAYSLENLQCLIQNGADVDLTISNLTGNALFCTVAGGGHGSNNESVTCVKNLLSCGAKVTGRFGLMKETILENLLSGCMNAYIINALAIARLLLNAGAPKTLEIKESVHRIGERFEFYRADFNKECLDEFSDALMELYKLFDVEPVPQRVVYDGSSPIVVKSGTWQKQHAELWDLLVPGRGHADTVQGEVIRIIGKVNHEILDNGAINWDADYKKLPLAMADYFKLADGLEASLVNEACILAKKVSANSSQAMLYRLNELTVRWVLANPNPIKLQKVDYER
ncbi:MAG: hypothetical protein K2N94_03125 [Lachnospiraceae bacterium]|nr:hypothetical protein [Lachnospiraceae bacterium]